MNTNTLKKMVLTAMETMLSGLTRTDVCKVKVEFDGNDYGYARSIDNVIAYQDLRKWGYKEEIICAYADYSNSIDIYTTKHNDNGLCLGYAYKFCIRMNKKTQIEIACELCQALAMAQRDCKY